MARFGAVAAHGLGLGKAAAASSPPWRRWRITTEFSSVGLLRGAAPAAANPPGETALAPWLRPVRIVHQQIEPIARSANVNDRASRAAAVQPPPAAGLPAAPGRLRPSSVSAHRACPGSRTGAPLPQKCDAWQRSASYHDSRGGHQSVTPLLRQGVSTSRSRARQPDPLQWWGFKLGSTAGVVSIGRSRGPASASKCHRRAGWPVRSR